VNKSPNVRISRLEGAIRTFATVNNQPGTQGRGFSAEKLRARARLLVGNSQGPLHILSMRCGWIVFGCCWAGSALAVPAMQERADRFLDLVNAGYQALYRVQSEAQWKAATDVGPVNDEASETAGRAYAAFTGNPVVIVETKELLKHKNELTDIQIRELERVLLNAAEGPMTNPELVGRRIAAETEQASKMNGFQFRIDGTNVIANDIDRIMADSREMAARRKAWEASKEIGKVLKPGLVELRDLRNKVAAEMGYPNYFALQTASYGMTAEEMVSLNDRFLAELKPLFVQLHAWARRELAKRYGQGEPKAIPTHWIGNRWAQEWDGLVEAASLDRYFKGRTAESMVKFAEDFYVGLGFERLPTSFWAKSDLYPADPKSARKKNAHASCWHVDLDHDVRSLMSVEPTPWWFFTAHHELGHGYYFLSYTRPEVPPLLRLGANPAFHEGIGEQISLAASQTPYLKAVGILPGDAAEDGVMGLLDTALGKAVPFMFFASGTMTHWEYDLYAKALSPDEFNARWWAYVREYQGVEPPGGTGSRTEDFCDPATKTHINDNPAYYYSYAIATVQKFQLHDYIARHILHQPPQSCNYYGNKDVGNFLKKILEQGATRDWRVILKEATGEERGTRAMREYFAPLERWLSEQNKGQAIGW
jgi:peptidyl-dipeptidase A